MLTERRARILGFVVDEYVDSVQPVGSQTVARKYGLPISAATVRSEMVRLEEEGYIAQPYTSAGRVPSDKGYRYYVETLMVEEEPPLLLHQTIRHQFHQAAQELEEWARLAATILARQVENLALVTIPHAQQARLRWLELVPLQKLLIMLIVVLQGARIRQQTLSLDGPLEQEELEGIGRKLNQLFAGLTASEVRQRGAELPALEGEIAKALVDLLGKEEEARVGLAFLEGLRHLLQQPEFAHSERILDVLDTLDDRNLPKVIPLASIPEEGVTVIIGSEHPEGAMRQCSLVVTRYGGQAGVRGTLGVLGPTRMHYPRAVSRVRHMASLMNELMEAYFG